MLERNFVDDRFAKAVETFETYAAAEEHAQLAVYVGGRLVADVATNLKADNLMTIYSVSKALAALALAKLVERGQLDLDETVAHYWPEFAAKGKQNITVRQLLSHQAGLPETDIRLTDEQLLDPHAAANALAEQRPLWQPGKVFGYHGISIGPLMSELCFRITGQTIQEFYETEVRQNATADAYLGLPAEHEPRVVELIPGLPPTPEQEAKYARLNNWQTNPLDAHVFGRGLDIESLVGPKARRFGLASAAGVASARGLADVMNWATGYGNQTPGIDPDVLEQFAQMQVYGLDAILDQPARSYGIVFMKPTPILPFGSHRAFGHDGAGGAMLIADPAHELVLGYTIRRTPYPGGMDPRLFPVLQELHTAIAKNHG